MEEHADRGPRCTADVLCYRFVDKTVQLLLVKRKYEPFQDHWALPGGFVESDETIRKAAKRELKEETRLDPDHLHQFKAYGGPDRDPRGPVVTICYIGLMSAEQTTEQAQAHSDAREVGWHDAHQPPALAFDHQQILQEANDELAEGVLHTPLAFWLLSDPFTMENVHRLYEQIRRTSVSREALSNRLLEQDLISPVSAPGQEVSDRRYYRLNKEQMIRYIKNNMPFFV